MASNIGVLWNSLLQMSPFSALISLKKSPVTDKAGAPLLPQVQLSRSSQNSEATIAALAAKNLQLEADLRSLRKEHTDCVEDCEGAYRRIKQLESQPAFQTEIKLETDSALCTELDEKNCVLETLQVEIKQLKEENSDKDIAFENQKVEVYDLKLANKKASETSNKLNKVLSDLKIKFKKEKNAILKQNKAEIKYWRKELGEETKVKIKLEEKLNEPNEHPLKIPADDI
jgi:chromosome segregation ATPase